MKNSEQPAFPKPHKNMDDSIQYDVYNGLTKREYFAIKCLSGLLSNSAVASVGSKPSDVITAAIGYTDELLKQLEK